MNQSLNPDYDQSSNFDIFYQLSYDLWTNFKSLLLVENVLKTLTDEESKNDLKLKFYTRCNHSLHFIK